MAKKPPPFAKKPPAGKPSGLTDMLATQKPTRPTGVPPDILPNPFAGGGGPSGPPTLPKRPSTPPRPPFPPKKGAP